MYDDYYGFSGKPFRLTPDHKFFFNSKGHNRAMAYLRYGLEQGEGFIVITGGVGTGKTTLVRNLFEELADKNVMAAQLVTTQVEPDDMLRMVCASFGLAHEGLNKATLLHNLEAVARARHAEGKQILLVVDEAQNLPARSVEELRMLSNFQINDKALVQSFLLGQEEFKRTLQSPGMEQFRQRIIASYHLEPLNEDEMEKYIKHRLTMVGWKDSPTFDDGIFSKIYDFTGGVPRRVNALCDRFMLFGCLEERKNLGLEDIDTVIEELRGEVAYQPERKLATVSPISNSGGSRGVETATPGGGSEAATACEIVAIEEESELICRVQELESELCALKKTIKQEQKLLRKAILLQLDVDEFEEV